MPADSEKADADKNDFGYIDSAGDRNIAPLYFYGLACSCHFYVPVFF